jgi:hypothetical protein
MSWIDDGLKRQKEASIRREKISGNAPNLYQELWQEIERCVDEAKKGGMRLHCERYLYGDTTDREVRLSVIPSPTQSSANPKTLHVTLSDDSHSIEITRDSGLLKLDVDISVNGVPLLKHAGVAVSIPKAAQLILEPFFFSV